MNVPRLRYKESKLVLQMAKNIPVKLLNRLLSLTKHVWMGVITEQIHLFC